MSFFVVNKTKKSNYSKPELKAVKCHRELKSRNANLLLTWQNKPSPKVENSCSFIFIYGLTTIQRTQNKKLCNHNSIDATLIPIKE